MMMIPVHVIAFFLAIIMVPEDVNQFTIAVQCKEIQWTRQEAGWHAVELPRDDWGIYSVQGSEVTVSGEGRVVKTKVSRFLSLPERLEWKNAAEVQVADSSLGDPIQIQREAGKIVLSQAKGSLFEKPVTITWTPVAKGKANELADAPATGNTLPLAADETLFEIKDNKPHTMEPK